MTFLKVIDKLYSCYNFFVAKYLTVLDSINYLLHFIKFFQEYISTSMNFYELIVENKKSSKNTRKQQNIMLYCR